MTSYASATSEAGPAWTAATQALPLDEARRARNYPISRWYLRPLAGFVSRYAAHSAWRPWHVTLLGFSCTLAAVAMILWSPTLGAFAAPLVLAAWFCDRLDGQLARRQGTATPYGAWLDSNLDELADLALQTAFAAAAAEHIGQLAWWLWGAFVTGKYLFMYGLASEAEDPSESAPPVAARSAWAQLYHLPANADVRIHLAILAAYCGAWSAELGAIAVYYQCRWMARYLLVAKRLQREAA